MFENIYAWLLRFYPSRFREEYGEEILQLFRDRTRNEKGFFLRLRLWLDLLADFVISVPREHYHFQPEFFGVSAQRVEGTPAFFVLKGGSPRPEALFSGGMLTLASVIALSMFVSQPSHYRPLGFSTTQSRSFASDRPAAVRRAAGQGTDGVVEKTGVAGQPAAPVEYSKPGETEAGQSSDAFSQQGFEPAYPRSAQPQASESLEAANTMTRGRGQDATIDEAERHRVIRGAIANLKQYYVYPEIAQKTSDALLAREKNGDYGGVKEGGVFADLLTKQMRNTSQDMHLDVVYSQDPLPEHLLESIPKSLERYREAIEPSCRFKKIETLPHRIGYLKLNSFPDLSVCEATARAEMSHLNDAAAIIFDLRDNRGGDPDMVMLLAAYLFDHPEYMYSPRENTTQQSWTRSPVPGNKLADKPAYILTSGLTSSAAEHFSYDLKMLKRATVVGETTRGAAHSGVFHRIDEHFGMGIPETKPINPFSKSDWAVVGVEPDAKVKAADALETAIKLAQARLHK